MQKLEKLLHQVYRAFPQKHWGNSRDAFCFRRVQIPIETFKVGVVHDLAEKCSCTVGLLSVAMQQKYRAEKHLLTLEQNIVLPDILRILLRNT